MITIYKRFTFEAAHWLPNVEEGHQCGRMHGHSYKVTVGVSGSVDPVSGWILDLACVKAAVKPVIDSLDHRVLNEVGIPNPTVENLAIWFYNQLKDALPVCSVEVEETETSRCVYVV